MSLNLDISDHRRAHAEMNGAELHGFPARPLIHRETESPTEINRILNDPSVFPDISIPDQKPFDVAPIIADPRNVFLIAEGGCIIFVPDAVPGSGMYEVHTSFLEQYRGKHAIEASLEAYRWMFTRTPAMVLWTKVPVLNRAAEKFCRSVGASLWLERREVWPTSQGNVDLKFYSMSVMEWMRKHGRPLIESGKAFHARLEEEYARMGVVHDPHPDEESHDLAVGACAEMMFGGEAEKGVIIYNHWARVAGYQQIGLISRNPLLVDIGEAKLHVTGNSFKVLECRSAQL